MLVDERSHSNFAKIDRNHGNKQTNPMRERSLPDICLLLKVFRVEWGKMSQLSIVNHISAENEWI